MVADEEAMTDKRVDRTLKCNHERASGPPAKSRHERDAPKSSLQELEDEYTVLRKT